MVELPATFEVREAIGGGDCFFDSVAQGLTQLKPGFSFTVKSLRGVCKRFAQSQSQNDQSWLKEALKSEQETINYYIERIEFTANDIRQQSGAASILGLTSPIWGRSNIEGRIICEEYCIKLHVIENHVVEEKQVWTHEIVESKGSRSVGAVDYDSEENTVHVVNTGSLHFQPILRIKIANNEQLSKYCNKLNDKIHAEKELTDIVKSPGPQESKQPQAPHDQIEDNSYVKNKNAAQTEGYSYQVKLSMMLLLYGKEKVQAGEISRFYLATDMKEVPGFGDIVFKAEGSSGSKVTFLQTKHKEKETNVTKDILLSRKVFNLNTFFGDYTTIKKYLLSKKRNQIFEENFSDVHCSFIIFTNVLPQFSSESDIYKKAVDPEDIMNFGEINYYYALSPSGEIDLAFLGDSKLSQKEELREFLHALKLFFGQPNEHELGEIIKQKVQSVFSVEENLVEVVFAGAQNKMQEWFRKKGQSYFLTSENRFFEDAARVSIRFDVKEPVSLFTGRSRELENLHKILQNAGEAVISQTVTVTGIGGVGKTELARKYISEHSKEYDDNVIWINAENYITTTESFIRVAEDKLGINTLDENGKRRKMQIIVQEIYDYFARMRRKSLFVFDNSGRYKAIGDTDEGIDKFLPPGPDKPYVLITCRDQKWGNIKTLPLDVFTEDEAAEFIKKAIKDIVEVKESEVKRLAEELQYLPLALSQAVAYIRMENKFEVGRFTVSNYLDLFKERARDLLSSRGSSEILDRYSETVMTTWEITIAKIRQKKFQGGEEAVKILHIMSYLAPDKIPIDDIFSTLINDEKLRHSAVELLDQYSIISLAGGKVNIHRLVQQVARIELKEEGKSQEMVQETLKLLRESFPYGSDELDDISKKKKLLPHLEMILFHVDHLITEKPKDASNIEKQYLRGLLSRVANGYHDLGHPKREKELLERALKIEEYHFEPNQCEVANMLNNLGIVHGDLGDPFKQKELSERALKIMEVHNGLNHFEVAKILISLSIAHGALGNHCIKKDILEQALKIQEDYYGPNHLEVAKTLTNLANAYGDLGEPYKEKELLERALIIKENHYKPNHFEIAITLGNLGIANGELGDHNKKKELLERALKILEEHYGPNYFLVAKTLVNLSNAYADLGDPNKQKELLERALKIEEDYYGPNHFHVAAILTNLSTVGKALGDPHETKELLERALKINEDHYGKNHFEVAKTLTNLGNAYGALGDPGKQKELLERVLKINEDHYGKNHFEVAKTLTNLGNAHGALGDSCKRKDLLQHALKIKEHYYGPNHFKVAVTLVSLGIAYEALGDHYKKKEVLERALRIQEDYYGPNHLEVSKTLTNLSKAYRALSDLDKQKELLERALGIVKDHYGPDHFEFALTLVDLGVAHWASGDHQKAKERWKMALPILEIHYGPNHSFVGRISELL